MSTPDEQSEKVSADSVNKKSCMCWLNLQLKKEVFYSSLLFGYFSSISIFTGESALYTFCIYICE